MPGCRSPDDVIEWRFSDRPVDYAEAVRDMEHRAHDIRWKHARELVWLLEHPPLYTAGTSARSGDLLSPGRFPVHRTGRGGQYTYHGPGQRVAYVMLDLARRRPDVRCYVHSLEEWVITALARFNVTGIRSQGQVGIWVRRTDRNAPARQDKIAAIGVRIRRWVTLHGVSLNVAPDLEHFGGIVPCGVRDGGVTSLEDLGVLVSIPEVDVTLKETFAECFGPGTRMELSG
ncbi:MAG: lipoyl(octanoyl) transferase LipB [Alphaproteobacteria bacterium]|nr:lipoyl(octanoyl) transferase LipB [Alphaproteobacteria bacterium]